MARRFKRDSIGRFASTGAAAGSYLKNRSRAGRDIKLMGRLASGTIKNATSSSWKTNSRAGNALQTLKTIKNSPFSAASGGPRGRIIKAASKVASVASAAGKAGAAEARKVDAAENARGN